MVHRVVTLSVYVCTSTVLLLLSLFGFLALCFVQHTHLTENILIHFHLFIYFLLVMMLFVVILPANFFFFVVAAVVAVIVVYFVCLLFYICCLARFNDLMWQPAPAVLDIAIVSITTAL